MKKLLFIIVLICMGMVACGQGTAFPDLPEVTANTSPDQVALYRSGAGVRMLISNLLKPANDSLASHLTRIEALEAGGVVSYWTKSGTNLSPLTSGDDVLLRDATEVIAFSDGDTRIQEPVDDVLHFFIGGTSRWSMSTTNINLSIPLTPSGSVDFGGSSAFFGDGFMDKWYVEDLNTSIYLSGSDLMFDDASNIPKSLAELAAGVSYSAGSGLTLTSTTFSLGGALSGQSLITGTGSANDILLRHVNTGNYSQHLAIEGDSAIELIVFADDDYTGYESGIFVSEGIVTMQARGSVSPQKIMLTATEMLVTDGANESGLRYDADYSANYTNRSLVDKEYVDDAVVGGDTIPLGQLANIFSDTIPQFVFGYGTGRATDTLDCWDGAEIGAFLTGPTDSISCVSFTGVVTTGVGTPTVTVQFFYDVNLNDGTPTAITAATAFVSTTSGTVISSFTNQTIPPGVWVWGEITTVSAGNKPVKLRITMQRYKRTGE